VGGVQREETGRVEIGFEEGEEGEGGKRTKIALVGTVQFIAALQGLKEELEREWRDAEEEEGKEVLLLEAAPASNDTSSSAAPTASASARSFDRGIYAPFIPQIRPLSPGEILGCTSPTLPSDTDAVLYVGDGRFHLESVMIANPRIAAFRYDPYDAVFVREWYDHARMREGRERAVRRARVGAEKGLRGDKTHDGHDEATQTNGASAAGTSSVAPASSFLSPSASGWGLILGTLGRQGSLSVLSSLLSALSAHAPRIPAVPILLSELSPAKLALFGQHLDAFVQTSCPRLSLDWGEAFEKPLLSPYEANVALGVTRGWGKGRGVGMEDLRSSPASSLADSPSAASLDADDPNEAIDYPMDFYADDSRGPWTPRHGLGRKKQREGKTSNRDLLRRAGAARAAAAAKMAETAV
jgi:2-(3-amino-3-carboxypropyl)histidine synthase